MRRDSHAVVVPVDAKSDFGRDGRVEVHSSDVDDDLDAAISAAVCDAKRLVDDLSHDLRQPLSSVSLNVQSAIRCLQLPEPRVTSALQALRECLGLESELLALVTAVQRRLSKRVVESQWQRLDDHALDVSETPMAAEWTGWQTPAARGTEDPPSARAAWAGRASLAAIARSILALARTNPGAWPCDPAGLRIETRRVSDHVQLRLSGIPCHSTDDIDFLRACVESATSHLAGRVSFELGLDESAIVISFPSRTPARRPTFARGHHGA